MTTAEHYASELLADWRASIISCLAKYDTSRIVELRPDLLSFLGTNDLLAGGADDAAIRSAEARLNVDLPDDYIAFIRLVNGWPAAALVPFGNRFLMVEDIDFYKKLYPEQFAIWKADADQLRDLEQVRVYGRDQFPERFCSRHLDSCIGITTHEGSGAYVLNPEVRTSTFFEAWWLDFHLPGAMRFPSFFALLEHEIPRSVSEIESSLS